MHDKDISVIGLGVVGLVTSLRLCEKGHRVFGIDKSSALIRTLYKGRLSFHEPHLETVLQQHLNKKFFIGDYTNIKTSDIIVICVNTPNMENGGIDLSNIENSIEQIKKYPPRPIILRSTVLPKTTEIYLKNKLQGWPLIYYPEFLRQQKAWDDCLNPSLKVYATLGSDGKWFESLYEVDSSWHKVHIRTAEYIKYMNNSFHALKVVFANEMGVLGNHLGVDMNECYHLFVSDHTLNLSCKYLRPGLPFGGECLGKDLVALNNVMQEKKISAPVISSINKSNYIHYQHILHQLDHTSNDICGFIQLYSKKWGYLDTNPIFNLAKNIKNSYVWDPHIDQLDIDPVKKTNSLDELLNISKKIVVATSKKDFSFWQKICLAKADIYIFEKNQIPIEFQKKKNFHILKGDAVH